MKKDDIRLLRIKAQELGIKYVTKYSKSQLKAMIAQKDPDEWINQVYGQPSVAAAAKGVHTQTVKVPKGITTLNINIELV